jgi:hypothetical protein
MRFVPVVGISVAFATLLSSCIFISSDSGSGGSSGAAQGGSAGAGQGGNAGAGQGGTGQSGQGGSAQAGSGGGAQAGSGGAGGDGSVVIPEGPPGGVGNSCKPDKTCDAPFVCGIGGYCQPTATSLPSNIKQAVPPPDTGKVPASSPIFLFADAVYTGLTFKVEAALETGTTDITANTIVTKLTSGANKDIYVLSSKSSFPLGSSIVVTLSGPFTGKLVFDIDHQLPAYADGTLGLEGGAATKDASVFGLPKGWTGFGDVATIASTGSLKPTEGTKLAALTSGAFLGGQAIGGTSSLLVSGPITMGPSPGLIFDYNFQSSEFDDYCNSSYDDTFLAVLVGPKGAVAKVVNSVNLVCATSKAVVGTFSTSYATAPDGGDTVYKETGVLNYNISGDVGSPAVIAFVVTDVGDQALSTVVGIDKLSVVK